MFSGCVRIVVQIIQVRWRAHFILSIHVSTHTHTRTHARTRTHTQAHTRSVRLVLYSHLLSFIAPPKRMLELESTHACTHTHTQTHTHTHAHANTHARTHTHTHAKLLM